MSLRTPAGARRHLTRALTVGLAVLVSSGLGVAPAGAQEPVTVLLDPPEIDLYLDAAENTGGSFLVDPPVQDSVLTPVGVQWGASIVLHLPQRLSARDMEITLDVSPAEGAPPARSWSSDPSAPNPLAVTYIDVGMYRIELPADDGTSGTVGRLRITGLEAPSGFALAPFPGYRLDFQGTGNSTHDLVPTMVALADQPCVPASAVRCAGATVTAGAPFTLSIPVGSLLYLVGNPTPTNSRGGGATPFHSFNPTASSFLEAELAVQALDAQGRPSTAAPVVLTGDPARFSLPDPRQHLEASVTLPADLPAGVYRLSGRLGEVSDRAYSLIDAELQVLPAPVATASDPAAAASAVAAAAPVLGTPPAGAALNVGLRSETGWEETASGGTSPLVTVGAGAMLVAALGTAVALRPRRRALPDAGTCDR